MHSSIETQARQLLTGWFDGAILAPECVPKANELLKSLSDHVGDETLSYRIRLVRLEAGREMWPPAQYFQELQWAFQQHQRDPDRYPVHPLESHELSDHTRNELRIYHLLASELNQAPSVVAKDPEAPRDVIEHVLVADALLQQDEASGAERALVYRQIGLSHLAYYQAEDALAGYDPTTGQGDREQWAAFLEPAIRCRIDRRELQGAAELLDQMEQAGGIGGCSLLSDSLIPLSSVVDPATSARRAHTALQLGAGHLWHAREMVRIAIFMVRSGRLEQGLSLAEAADQAIVRPALVLPDLAAFFGFVVAAGAGERRLIQFTSPRWQRITGVADPRCQALADGFTAASPTPPDPWLTEPEVPQIGPEHWPITFVDRLRPVADDGLTYDPIETTYDQEVIDYITFLLNRQLSDDAPLPLVVKDHVDVMRWRDELFHASDDDERAESGRRLAAVVDDPATEPNLKIAVAFTLLIWSGHTGAPIERQAAQVLPMLANVSVEDAMLGADKLITQLRERGLGDSALMSNLLAFATGLVAGDRDSGHLEPDLADHLSQEGRELDAHLLAKRDLSNFLAFYQNNADLPQAAPWVVVNGVVVSAERLQSYQVGANYANLGARMAQRAGDAEQRMRFLGQAASLTLLAGDPEQALAMYDLFAPDDQTPASAGLLMAGAGIGAIPLIQGEQFYHLWPEAYRQFVRCASEAVAEDPGFLGVVHDDVKTSLKHLVLSERGPIALSLTSWFVDLTRQHGDLELRSMALLLHAISLDANGQYSQAAAVYETLVEWGTQASDQAMVDAAKRALVVSITEGNSPIYAQTLQQLGG